MSFFESISLSSQERVHSQVITWIFSNDCKAISLKDKMKILSNIANTDIIDSSSIKSITEFGYIDVLILCDRDAFIIENKIKIQTHSNQLERYEELTESNILTKDLNKHYIYLSLFPEDIKRNNWSLILHRDLYLQLSSIEMFNCNDEVLLQEYLKFHEKLINAQKQFFDYPEKHGEVYTYANKKKVDKIDAEFKTETSEFISKMQLETIFQTAYLKLIADEVSPNNFELGESHGMAYVNFRIRELIYNNQKFYINLQYQNNTLKISFIAHDYGASKKDDIPNSIIDFFKEELSSQILKQYTKLNLSKSKAYISRSKKVGLPYELSKSKLVSLLCEEVELLDDLVFPE